MQWRAGTLVYTRNSLLATFCWLLLGDFSWSLKERAMLPVAQLLLRQLQASDLFVALMIGSVPAGLAMLIGPVIGTWSDRHRGPRGRRIPFLMVPALLIGLALVALGYTQPIGATLHAVLGTSSPGLRACTLLVFCVLWATFEISSVSANAIYMALINDVVPLQLVGRFFGWFRVVSLVAGIAFTFYGMAVASSHRTAIFAGVGCLYLASMWVMCARVKEGEYPPVQVPEKATESVAQRCSKGLKRYMSECFSNRYYVLLFMAMTLGLVSPKPIDTFSLFYAQQMGLGLGDYGKLLALTYSVSLLSAVPIGWLADRFHPLRVALGAIIIYATTVTLAGILIEGPLTFAWVFVLHGIFTGAYITGASSLGQYLFPSARFAQFFSAMNVIQGVVTMIVPPAVGLALDLFDHNYRLSFMCSAGLAWVCALCLLALLPTFQPLGGVAHYRAPD